MWEINIKCIFAETGTYQYNSTLERRLFMQTFGLTDHINHVDKFIGDF